MVRESAPGKLYLAGEYAVVEAGYPAIIAAMNQRIWVEVTPSKTGVLHSSQRIGQCLDWQRVNGVIQFTDKSPYELVVSAMEVAEDYVRSQGVVTDGLYEVQITSDLDHAGSGTKYGLGSSGAVTVAVVKAILAYYQRQVEPLLLYKLAVLTQMKLGMTGSFGDIAASSFGGVIAYYSVDKPWLAQVMANVSLVDLLEMDWQGLQIFYVELPKNLELMVGWTGNAASTDQLVQQVQAQQTENERQLAHQTFLQASRTCVEEFIQACQLGDHNGVTAALAENRRLLQVFSQGMGILIETDQLRTLCQMAEEAGAVAKSSGAGGGDCGICLIETKTQEMAIAQAWQEKGIQRLDIAIAERETNGYGYGN